MANPFDQFDEASAGGNPFDAFDEEESSWLDKGVGALETVGSMLAPMPSTILGGLVGGGVALTQGIDKGAQTLEDIQKWNFGAGEYKPSSKKGQQYSENVGSALQYPVEKAGQFGEAIGGNAGRYVGELLVGSAMEMIEPTAIFAGAKGLARPRKGSSKVSDIRAQQEAVKAPPEAPKGVVGEQGNLFDQFDERSPISPYQTEMASDMWRVDENGIPIRADLSMEVQNLQQPLQRNLFGDELDVNFPRDPNKPLDMETGDIKGVERFSEPVRFRNDPENQIALTEAIDRMPNDSVRQPALDLLRRETPASAELEVAKMDADGMRLMIEQATGDAVTKSFNAAMRKQGGGLLIGNKKVEVVPTEDGFSARVDGKEVGYLRSNLTPEQRAQLGETANVDIVKVQDEFKSKGVGKALYDAWTKANNGKVAPSGKTSKDAWKVWKRDNPTAVEAFVKQEAARIAQGADERMVLGNITDPQIRERVSSFNTRTRGQGGAIDPDVFLKEFPNFVASTIKDAAGKLKVLYHGTSKDANFSDIKTGATGAWLTNSPKGASEYAKQNDSQRLKYNPDTRRYDELNTAARVMPVYANLTKPYILSPEDLAGYRRAENYTKFQRELTAKAKVAGHDGIDWGDGIYTVFTPAQIKSALSPAFVKSQKKQSGAILINPTEVKKIDNAQTQRDYTIPLNPNVEEVLSKARSEKDGKQWTYVQSGATSVAMKSGSTAIKAASRIVQNALKAADLAIRNNIFPAEGALRKLSRQEITDLSTLLKDEMFNGQRYDGDVLAKNLSVKQLEAYRNMRDLFDKTLDAQNEARLAKGQAPINPVEAYLSSRWEGDFRRPVYDANGKLVWYLAANSKRGLETQSNSLKKQFPDLLIDPKKDHTVTSGRSKSDLQSMYTTMLDLLGRDDPAIAKIQKAIEEQTVAQGEAALAQEKHFESKGNIRGFTGDRPGQSGSKEAIAMFQQQIQYAKNAFKWAEMQKAAEDIKAIVSDPVLQDTQPNNVKYIREYFKNAVGMGESQVSRALGDSIRTGLGVSPKVIDDAVGTMKSFFILQKLAASPGYILSNMIQAGNVMPYLANLRDQGYKGNPATAMLMGFPSGMMMGVAHILKATGGDYIDRLPNQFFKDAFQYAEDNGVTARSVYDEAPLETGFGLGTKAVSMAAKTMTLPETFVRSVAFMTYAQMLKDSGKFSDQSKMFQKAEELTNMSMVDYRETERPLMFAKAGTAGNFLNTLQTYPMSFYNQWAYMLKEATRGNMSGLVALAAFQYLVAGALGIPGFQDADDIYKYIRDNMVGTETYNKMAKSPFLSDPKLWMMENLGDASVYGVLSDQTGIGMTSRVAAPSGIAMSQSPLGPISDVAKQVGALGSAALDPTNKTKWAQSAILSAPVGLQGLLEQSGIMEGHTYNVNDKGEKVFLKNSDLADRSGTYARTPEEETIRNWGVRSQKEVVTRDVGYATRLANQTITKKSGELGSKIYDAARRGDVKKYEELTKLYVDLTGKELPAGAFDREIKEEFYTDIQKNVTNANTPRQLMNAAKMNKLLESR